MSIYSKQSYLLILIICFLANQYSYKYGVIFLSSITYQNWQDKATEFAKLM